jgi:hypothetical protein
MKYTRILVPVLALAFLFGAQQALAHTKASSGNISGVLYAEPHEGLQPGQPAVLNVDFSQSKEAFDAREADLTIAIAQGMEPNDPRPLTADTATSAQFPYTLEEGAPYNVMIVGTTSAGTAFHLMYELDPFGSHEAAAAGPEAGHGHGDAHGEHGSHGPLGGHGLHLFLLAAILVSIPVVVLMERRKNRQAVQGETPA